ncbi:NAD(P)/FAD-dependent oxidoreductase [Micromonospora chokoriensis]
MTNSATDKTDQRTVDVIVVGGGAAGLNGALILARSRRSVIVVDDNQPRNAPAAGVHGLLARDGIAPAELLRLGREEVARYGGQLRDGHVSNAQRDGDDFVVSLRDGQTLRARRLLVTTGLADRLPALPGLAERWGHEVVHCPYCHGWEVRDRAIGVLATGPGSYHHALLFRQLTDDLTYFAQGTNLDPDQAGRLGARGIRIVHSLVVSAETSSGRLTGLNLQDGSFVSRDVVAVATRMEARAGFLTGLGLEVVEHPSLSGQHIPADAFGRTSVPGVWVAGNVTDLTAQVGAAASAGATAGAHLNAELVAEDTDRALAS